MTNAEDPHDPNPAFGTDTHVAASPSQPDDLHDLFNVPEDDAEDPLAGMRNDPNYAALIRDLQSIAIEARRLFEPAEPEKDLLPDIMKKLNESSAKEDE